MEVAKASDPFVSVTSCPFFQYLAIEFHCPIWLYPATYTSLPSTTMELALPWESDTTCPFFQYLAVPSSDPATYTSLPTTTMEFALESTFSFVSDTVCPFFQYFAI